MPLSCILLVQTKMVINFWFPLWPLWARFVKISSMNYHHISPTITSKGQIILKCLFEVSSTIQKTNEQIWLYYYGTSSWIVFVHSFEELKTPKRHMEINCVLSFRSHNANWAKYSKMSSEKAKHWNIFGGPLSWMVVGNFRISKVHSYWQPQNM